MHRFGWTVGLPSLLALLAWLSLFLVAPVAQQAPPLLPSPQAELGKCREYTSILLNNSMRYEALAGELTQQKAAIEKELEEVKAKLKEAETLTPAPKGTN